VVVKCSSSDRTILFSENGLRRVRRCRRSWKAKPWRLSRTSLHRSNVPIRRSVPTSGCMTNRKRAPSRTPQASAGPVPAEDEAPARRARQEARRIVLRVRDVRVHTVLQRRARGIPPPRRWPEEGRSGTTIKLDPDVELRLARDADDREWQLSFLVWRVLEWLADEMPVPTTAATNDPQSQKARPR
jgi:hypothetical protein